MKPFDEKFKQFLKSESGGFRFGHYYLEGRLAHGGMAEVFVGRDLEFGVDARLCVIKCILPDLAGNTNFLAMFLNEAQLAAQMEHPNIVKVLDFGEHEGLLYMAMEYVDGMDCWRFARRGMPTGDRRSSLAVSIIMRVLDALDYAHNMTDVNDRPLNVVHRDLSPSNIYLGKTGEVKLGDFGIAEIKSSRYREIAYIPQGKFGYVSPEQLEGAPLDRRADVFAMGIVLAELLIGKKVFKGVSQMSVLLEIRDGRFDTIDQNSDRIDKRLLEIIYRALARDPADRFATAAELNQSLAEYIGDDKVSTEDLARYVSLAVDVAGPRSLVSSAAPAPQGDQATPSQVPTDPTAMSELLSEGYEELLGDEETPITASLVDKQGGWAYTLKLTPDRIVGPFTFAHMMELIYRNEIDHETLVSLNGSPFVQAEQLPELNRHIPVYTPTLDVADVDNPDKRGVLAVEAPAEAILGLALDNETGLFVCKQDERKKEVYFQNGRPVYVSSNNSKELLGEYLVSKGAIDRSELEMALEVLPKFDGHMGDTLIAMGMISAIDLFRSLGDQMRDRFLDLLTWRLGIYEFYRNIQCRPNTPEIPLDPFSFVCEALIEEAKTMDAEKTLKAIGECILSRSPNASALIDKLVVPKSLMQLILDLKEATSVDNLLKSLGQRQTPNQVLTAVFVALETGVWTVDGPSLPWRQ